jgi:hypothetical protein
VRLAPLEERTHALAMIVGAEQLGERARHPLAQVAPLRVERQPQAGLDPLHGQRRSGSDLLGQRHGRR